MLDLLLYILTVLIWRANWLATKYQLRVVAPEVSLVYRFALTAVIMVVLCVADRRPMRFSLSAHARMAVLGMLTYGRAQAVGLPVIQANVYGMGYARCSRSSPWPCPPPSNVITRPLLPRPASRSPSSATS